MEQIFLLGATGHIGGAILSAVTSRFPRLKVVALVRDHEKEQMLQRAFPRVQTRLGSLQDTLIIESESRAARIVINASPDGLPESAQAIQAALRGLQACDRRGFYIQTSGAYIIGEESAGQKPSNKVWSDIADVEQLINMPLDRFHSSTDRLVRQASAGVNVAIVSPTVVYGLSPSVSGNIPITMRDAISAAKSLSMGFTISKGSNVLGYVHVRDLAEIYARLVADALQDTTLTDGEVWGPKAYYFASSEEHTFSEYMEALIEAMKMRGIVNTNAVRRVESDDNDSELDTVRKLAAVHGFGANVRCRSDRAARFLGWTPQGPGLIETLPGIVELS